MLERVNTVSVVDEVVKRITDAIVARQLKPGEKIPPENELCQQLGVGRNSLREAMKILSAMGVLEIRRGDGTYIVEKIKPSAFDSLVYSLIFEQSTQSEILELRKTLEIDILELAAVKASQGDIDKLQILLEDFQAMIDKKDFELAASLDIKFHQTLVDIAQNPLLGRIVKGVYELFYASMDRTLRLRQEFEGAYQKHRDIVEVIQTRDMVSIPQVVEKSLEVWKDFVKNE